MLARQLIIVIVRLFALGLLLMAANAGLGLYISNWEADALLVATIWVTTVAVPVALAMMLWQFPQVLLVGTPTYAAKKGTPPAVNADDLQTVGLSLIGFWLLASGIPDAAQAIGRYMEFKAHNPAASLSPSSKLQMLAPVIKTVLGAAMALGARGIVGLVRRIRAIGS